MNSSTIDEPNGNMNHDRDLDQAIEHQNQLHNLGNQAVQLKLISGHGYHQGQYEIICQGQILTMPPQDAVLYLQRLIANRYDD